MTSVVDVAKFLLDESARIGVPEMSTMKLQKICYFAQGWHLAVNDGKPLFKEDFHSWKYGPVSQELYKLHRGEPSVTTESVHFVQIVPNLTEYQKDFLKKIFKTYMPYTGLQLGDISHTHKAWEEAGGGKIHNAKDNLMHKDSIQRDFTSIMNYE